MMMIDDNGQCSLMMNYDGWCWLIIDDDDNDYAGW